MSKITLEVDGKEFNKFNNFNIKLNYNGIASQFSFDGLAHFTDSFAREIFKPLQYTKCKVKFNGKTILTGVILNTGTSTENTINLAAISGYSITGVLEDCEIPIDVLGSELVGMTLKNIVEKVIKPFGLNLVVDDSVKEECSEVIEMITPEEGESCRDYIYRLCFTKFVIVTHDFEGNVVLERQKLDKGSIATYREGKPATKISLSVTGQDMHSKYTIFNQMQLIGATGIEYNAETPTAEPKYDTTQEVAENILFTEYRPCIRTQKLGKQSDAIKTAKRFRNMEYKAIKLTIETKDWTWYDGHKSYMILPNDIIDVISASNYLPDRTAFFVETIDLKGSVDSETAVITAVIPEVYTDNEPKIKFK